MKPHNVRVSQYFFPETHVVALAAHDPSGERHGSCVNLEHRIDDIEGDQLQHGVSVTLTSNDEKGVNPPYQFKIEAYGLFMPVSEETDELIQAYHDNFETVAVQILMGAIREHLASITSRGPWTTFIASVATINQETVPEEESFEGESSED